MMRKRSRCEYHPYNMMWDFTVGGTIASAFLDTGVSLIWNVSLTTKSCVHSVNISTAGAEMFDVRMDDAHYAKTSELV